MAALNFPSSPTLNQIYTANNRSWIWDGTSWVSVAAITGGSINNTTIGATTPSTGAFTTLSATGATNLDAGTVSAPGLYLEGETGTGLYRIGANNHGYAVSGAKVLDIASTGLGVAGKITLGNNTYNASTDTPFFTNTAASTGAKYLQLQNSGAQFILGVERSTGSGVISGGTAYASVLGTQNATSLQFATNNSPRLTIDSAGNAAFSAAITSTGNATFGTTSSSGTAFIGNWVGNTSFCCFVNNSVSGTTGAYAVIQDSTGATFVNAASGKALSLRINNADVAAITAGNMAVTGAITATGNITAYYSDERLKTRLGMIDGALAKVKSLDGFYFEANETAQALGYTKKREVGVSAQQVEAVLPEIIAPAPIDPRYKTLDYSKLIPLLIEAIKELSAEVERLKA